MEELEPRVVRCHHQVWNSARYVQTQRMMCHAIVEVNVVIGVLVVHCELLVVRVVPVVLDCDGDVHRIRVLIAVYRSHCFHRSHFP